jgi:hypothetical protein
LQAGQAERFAEVMQEVARLGVVGGLFFDKNAVHQQRGLGKRWMLRNGAARARGMPHAVDSPLDLLRSPK